MIDQIAIDLLEWEQSEPEPGGPLEGVFLDEDSSIRHHADALTRMGMLEVAELRGGLRLRATSFVGRVTLGRIQITIRPKIGENSTA